MNKDPNRTQNESDQMVVSRRYDLTGNGIFRTFWQQVHTRVIPMGNFSGGAGLRCLLVLSVLHAVGQPVFRILIRFERQLSALYRLLERVRGKG